MSEKERDANGMLWLVQACALHVGNLEEIEMAGERFVPYDSVRSEERLISHRSSVGR